MNASFFHLSSLMDKRSNCPFARWQQTYLHAQRKRDRLLWSSAFIGSSVFLLGVGLMAMHLPYQKTFPVEVPPAVITLDLSTDIAPAPPPPAVAALPEPQPIEEEPSTPLDAPSAPNPDVVLPKTHNFEKIKPVQHQKRIEPKKQVPKQKPVVTAPPPVQSVSASTYHRASSVNSISGSSPAHASAQAGGSTKTPASWQGDVLKKLEHLKRYPTDAQEDRQEGKATIRITINRQGHVLAVKLAKSSSYSLLDKEAVALAYRADPLPAVPETISGNNVTIIVPIEFYLN